MATPARSKWKASAPPAGWAICWPSWKAASHSPSFRSPPGLHGELRPYQRRGYSWLDFLKQLGLGACLADDMGLGKTIQTLALIERDRAAGEKRPVLLVCPTSVVGNWQKEAARFTPDLPVLVHHGTTRKRGAAFEAEAARHAMVISSYALLHRDEEILRQVDWAGVVLDEAQNIKNPETKQARAARALPAGFRITLTGTPVENNVGDLWSVMEFLNPGFLGPRAAFQRKFFVPIQVYSDRRAAERLRRITGPFIMRRLKSDKSIIADLPEKNEMKVFCNLTKEQASLYESVVKDAEEAIQSAEGIERKGLVLATLMKLKQVCNHPAQFLKDNSAIPGRSGKLARLGEMIEETLEVGDRSLIFTQFAEMGQIIRKHLQETYGVEVLFLYGGTAKKQRDLMVERFAAPGGPRIFLLSLKAGGTGPEPDQRQPRLSLRPLVEPRGREPGHRPRLSHRADAQRPGAQVRLRRHAGREDRRDDRAQEGSGRQRGGRRAKRGSANCRTTNCASCSSCARTR